MTHQNGNWMNADQRDSVTPTLFDRPSARANDRQTSKDAAASVRVETVTKAQKLILEILKDHPSTDEQIFAALTVRGLKISPSGARTRRKELEDANKVEAGGTSETSSGRKCVLWKLK